MAIRASLQGLSAAFDRLPGIGNRFILAIRRAAVVIIDKSLAYGLVRSETGSINDGLGRFSEVLSTLSDHLMPRFRNHDRLSCEETRTVASELHAKAQDVLKPCFTDMTHHPATKGRPRSDSWESFHYWIRPTPIEGSRDRNMRLAAFLAHVHRRGAKLDAHDVPMRFHEHAARRFLERQSGTVGEREAVRIIGQRIAETVILPCLTVDVLRSRSIGTQVLIPLRGGLLLGSIVAREKLRQCAGIHRTVDRRGAHRNFITMKIPWELEIRTFIGAWEISPQQEKAAHAIDAWLGANHAIAARCCRHRYAAGTGLVSGGQLDAAAFERLTTDYSRLMERLGIIGRG